MINGNPTINYQKFIGELRDWWTDHTKREFFKRATDIINQYSHYHIDQVNITINGIKTLGENIADNGGLKAAYSGYGEFLNSQGD